MGHHSMFRGTAAFVCVAATGLAIVTVGGTTAGATTGDYRPLVTEVELETPTGLAATDTHLFVTDGNVVNVYRADTRELVEAVTGVFGATSPVVAPDGSSVFVAARDGSQIKRINAAGEVLGTATTTECPRSVQVTPTTLWYLGDCTAPFHVYTLPIDDLTATPAKVPGLSTSQESRMPLRVKGSVLALAGDTTIDTFDIDAEGVLTPGTSITVSDPAVDFELSDDALFAANPTNADYRRYNLTSGSLTGSYPTGPSPRALAVSPDGTQLGAGIQTFYEDGLFVFDVADGTKVVHGPVDIGESSYAWSTDVSFTPDGTRLYGLARYWTGSSAGYLDYLVGSTTSEPGQLKMDLNVGNHRTYGQPMRLTAVVTDGKDGVAGSKVTFTVTATNGRFIRTVSAVSSARGVATASVKAPYSGTVSAQASGVLTANPPKSKTVPYVAPSKFDVAMTKASAIRHGVRHYSSVKKVGAAARLYPQNYAQPVRVTLQSRVGGRWQTVDSARLTTDSHSIVAVHLVSGQAGVPMRFGFQYGKTSYSGATSAQTGTFVVDHAGRARRLPASESRMGAFEVATGVGTRLS